MTHGLIINETSTSMAASRTTSMAIIGLVATATAAAGAATTALNAAFPLNTPVLVTDIDTAISDAGTGGTLLPALQAIADITSPIIVVVRVAAGANAGEADANAIGGSVAGKLTGMQALRSAETALGVRPRILGAPGLDTQAVSEALSIVARKLDGRTYAKVVGETVADANTYRANFSHAELSLIWPGTNGGAADAVARALGLRAYIDETTGWHKTISNVALSGVTSITKDVHFDLLDASTDAGVLNDHDIVTIIRTSTGFRFWGNTTCSDDAAYRFESAVRTKHALRDIIRDTFMTFFDRPMNKALIKDLLETANRQFAALVKKGWIMGAKASFDAASNTSDQLAAGRPTFRIDFTPCAPLDNPTVQLNITDYFYTGFADAVNA
jgi:phage tail sheath protein FI